MCEICNKAWALFSRWEADWAERHPDDERDGLTLLDDPAALLDWQRFAETAPEPEPTLTPWLVGPEQGTAEHT